MMTSEVRCKRHPKYTSKTAKRSPTSDCAVCWEIFRRKFEKGETNNGPIKPRRS